MRRGDAEERAEGGVSGAASVEAEDELVEVGLEVFATQAMIDAEYPALEVGEEAVGPGQHNMGGHAADDMRVVRDTGSTGIAWPAVGLDGGAGGEIGLEEGMQATGRIVGHLLQADATGAGPAVRDLDGADHEYLSLMATPATASQGIVLAAADDLGFVDLDEAGERAAVAGHHAAPQFGTQQPGRFVRAEAELALQLQRRDAVGMGGHQIGR